MEAPTPAPAPAPAQVVPSVEPPTHRDTHEDAANKPALTPPTSEDMDKRDERMSSELSDLDSDDGEDIEPDHYWDGGKIPVFKPVRCIPRRLLPRCDRSLRRLRRASNCLRKSTMAC
jgi:hypothetical protein